MTLPCFRAVTLKQHRLNTIMCGTAAQFDHCDVTAYRCILHLSHKHTTFMTSYIFTLLENGDMYI